MYRRYRPLAIPSFQPRPQPRPLLVSRYARMNPLLRLYSLQALFAPLPEPLRSSLIWTLMQTSRPNGTQAIQSRERQRLPEDVLPDLPPWRLDSFARIELEVGRRIVEISRTEISQQERAYLLREQGQYLAHIYDALVTQLGEASAQTVFTNHVQAR